MLTVQNGCDWWKISQAFWPFHKATVKTWWSKPGSCSLLWHSLLHPQRQGQRPNGQSTSAGPTSPLADTQGADVQFRWRPVLSSPGCLVGHPDGTTTTSSVREHLLLFRGRQRDLQGEGQIKLLPGTCRRHENLQRTKPKWPCFQLDTTAFNEFRCRIWTTLGMQHKWFRCKRDPQLLASDLQPSTHALCRVGLVIKGKLLPEFPSLL